MHIIGTAGHVDHGKSSLVAALTGTHPDRWIEEQIRGMTLDLGFARLRFEDGSEAGIVDVPGHERFLHNMLAGAAGMELLMLVVAANEGVMPQTLEHLQILRFLNVRRVVVALTKIDLIEPRLQGEACRLVHGELRGTIAENAPIFAVSTVTGANLDVLKLGLAFELAALEERDARAPAYMPIDRVFTLPGRGTIVTGTLMQGRLAPGDTVTIEPGGTHARVRTLHVFGEARDAATGGTRVAINLPNVEKSDLARGNAIADTQFASRATYDVSFRALDESRALLRRRNPVRAYIGSAEVLGTLVLTQVPQGDEAVRGELFLREPVLAFPGVRFVVRRVSPKTLLGGGEVAGAGGGAVTEVRDASAALVLEAIRARGLDPADRASLAFAVNLREDVVARACTELVESGDTLRVARPEAFVEMTQARSLLERALAALADAHTREPWGLGLTSLALARALPFDESVLVRVLNAFAEDGRVAHRAGYFSTPEHVPKLTTEQRGFFEAHLPLDPAAPFVPANFDLVAAEVKKHAAEGLTRALETLLVRGALVRVGEALYRGTQIEQIHAKLEDYIDAHERITMAEFRNLLGTSRKYAVPLLEWFDSRGVTVRSGDYRMLRTRRGARTPAV